MEHFGRQSRGRRTKALLPAVGVAACLALAALAVLPHRTSAQTAVLNAPAGIETLSRCAPVTSLDGRLVMEQWAWGDKCDQPVRTRVTDRFLGFTCQERSPGTSIGCRSLTPPPGSGKFDTSRFFRCVDIGVVETELGIAVSRMREWASPLKQCDWSRSAELLMMEVDFASGQVCVGGLCIQADRLSMVGQLRLRRLITKALNEFGIGVTVGVRAP
jgi:hypothetical protein